MTQKIVKLDQDEAGHLNNYLMSIDPVPQTLDAKDWFPDGFETNPHAAALGARILGELKLFTYITGVSSSDEFLQEISACVASGSDYYEIEG